MVTEVQKVARIAYGDQWEFYFAEAEEQASARGGAAVVVYKGMSSKITDNYQSLEMQWEQVAVPRAHITSIHVSPTVAISARRRGYDALAAAVRAQGRSSQTFTGGDWDRRSETSCCEAHSSASHTRLTQPDAQSQHARAAGA